MYHNPDASPLKKIFSSKITIFALLLIFVFIIYNIAKEKKGQSETVKRIDTLQTEIAEFEAQNLSLAEMIKYLRSNDFIEREAREKLSMQKVGEKVVIVPKTDEAQVAGASTDTENMPNYLRWWKYFFE